MGVTVKVVKREALKKVKNKEDLVSLLKIDELKDYIEKEIEF